MNIARYAMARSTSVWVLMVILLIGGYLSYQQLGRFEDPEFVIRQAVIVTAYPGATAQEVADEVTDVIEGAVQALQELDEVKSVSRQGASEVTVEIKLQFSRTRAELDQVWDKLRRKVGDAQRLLPPGAGPSIVNDDFSDVYAQFYAVTGAGYSDRQLHDYVDMLRRELALVPGVAKTAMLANRQEQIFIEFASERLASFGVSAEQVYQVLQQQNLVTVAGDLLAGDMRVAVTPSRMVQSFADLQTLQIGVGAAGKMVRLGEVARVYRDYKEPPAMLMTYNGERALGLGVSNISGGNVVRMGDAVKARLAELEGLRPIGMELHAVSLQSDSVRASVANFVDNLIAAVLIVFLVLLAFMGVRSGIIIGFVLLLTVAGTLIIMLLDDIAMQRISLGALIIALGMLVDNAIVVTDGVLVRLRQGQDSADAISEVVESTQWPLLGGTVVGILAFSAIGLSPSDMGEYAGSLFWVILYSMLLSWVFSITITPVLCHQFLQVRQGAAEQSEGRLLGAYRGVLLAVLRHRLVSLLLMLGLLVAAIAGMGRVPPGFLPDSQRPQFVVDVFLPEGTDIRHTTTVLGQIAAEVGSREGVGNITTFVGGGGLRFMLTYSPEARNSAYGQLLVDVEDYRHIGPLVSTLQSELSNRYSDASIKVWKFMLGRGGGKKIEAGFRGPDSAQLRQLAEQAKVLMRNEPSLIAVQDDWRQQVPVARPEYNQERLQQTGLTAPLVNQALAQQLSGRGVGVFRENNELIPLIVRPPLEERQHERAIENTSVYSQQAAARIPLSQLIERVSLRWEDAMIRRIDRVPTILVQADPAPGILTGEAFERIRAQVESIPLPPGYTLTWYGEYKASRDANAGLALSAPYGFAAMILAVVFMFNALRQPLVIWLTAPLAVVGVVVGLVLFQTPFEFMAILGFLSLIGMMVKNAIVLVDQADADIRAGQAPAAAVVNAAISRSRPVVLGALTTILGVAPLLLDPFFKSMAVTIMFGLLFATLLTLLALPLLYAMVCRPDAVVAARVLATTTPMTIDGRNNA